MRIPLLCALVPATCLSLASQAQTEKAATMISLGKSIHPIHAWFEQHEGTNRFLAILSPRCDKCIDGARAIQSELLANHPNADINVAIAWIPMVADDDHDAAVEMSQLFANDSRVTQFDDSERLLGSRIGKQLLYEGAGTAWDIYMFYDKNAKWDSGPPAPTHWIHQLSGGHRGDPELFRTGEALPATIHELTDALLDESEPEQTSMTPAQTSNTIEFLYFGSCPNHIELRANLDAALAGMVGQATYTAIDLESLSVLDSRRGYGSPTILVNGKDLFDAPSRGTSLSCRIYPEGVPEAEKIAALLSEKD